MCTCKGQINSFDDLHFSEVIMFLLHYIIFALLIRLRSFTYIKENDFFDSPCPKIFNYHVVDGELKYGLIKVQHTKYIGRNDVVLTVDVSIGHALGENKGDLSFLRSTTETVNNVFETGAIKYKLTFPEWHKVPPKILSINYNGKIICQGQGDALAGDDIETIVSYKHSMVFEYEENDNDNDKEYNNTTQQSPKSIDINYPVCGRALDDSSLYSEGKETQKGQYPWLAAIFRIRKHGTDFLCGGSLISPKHVLTAAHCMREGIHKRKVRRVFVRVGAHNLQDWMEIQDTQTVGVTKIIIHPDYKSKSADADIALILLSEDVPFSTLIRPVCLWHGDKALGKVVGKIGIVAGWGKDESFQISEVPKQVRIPIVSQVDCLRSHESFRRITSKRTFCAGSRNGVGPCEGDSGGAFLLRHDGRWVLRGITSRSIAQNGYCDFYNYAVFTDITNYIEWLQKLMNS